MQNLKNLQKEDRELVELAGEHAKKRFKKDFISIAGALRTKTGKIYTGINRISKNTWTTMNIL